MKPPFSGRFFFSQSSGNLVGQGEMGFVRRSKVKVTQIARFHASKILSRATGKRSTIPVLPHPAAQAH